MSGLVVVESPAKAKTIKKYLGKGFEVLASFGHVRDLVPKEGAVDPDNNYAMKYEVISKNKKHVDAIKKAMKQADTLYLASDPDREGEAISWHLYELLKKELKDKIVKRVVFNEITKRAVQEAMSSPRELSEPLIDAQQARRALDYLVGFNLSPLLWRKVSPGLSAGRVQTPALRMIVEREQEIEAFEAKEYWKVRAEVEKENQGFEARLTHLDGDKLKQFDINNEALAHTAKASIEQVAGGVLNVEKVEKKDTKRNPAPPFTTSTLQQEAVRKLRFTSNRTMRVAQQLYEGIDLGGGSGTVGLITYMRTDSVHLAQEALNDIRNQIGNKYGEAYLPDKPRFYKTKTQNAQEAHEAVRPTAMQHTPASVKSSLTDEQFKLYQLIYKRTIACQMMPAVFDSMTADLSAGAHTFRATGQAMKFAGFTKVYTEGMDDVEEKDEGMLPQLQQGEQVNLNDVLLSQHFTEPPPRYTEASLVRALEEYGIGRPSTYASIISTLLNREYVEFDQRRFVPTDTGRIVSGFLTEHFQKYVDYEFTAKLEGELDAVSRGELKWIPLIDNFWKPLELQIEDKAENVSRADVANSRELGTDPKSGKPVSVRMGRYGAFAQIGTKDDEEKPQFASLQPGQKINSITLEEALELFNLPRVLGTLDDGEEVKANQGRYGPYVQYGPKKYVSIPAGEDPYTIDLDRAKELIAEKIQADKDKFIRVWDDKGVQVINGRYGPYITDGKKNAKIPKDKDPAKLTLEECLELLEKAPARRKRSAKK